MFFPDWVYMGVSQVTVLLQLVIKEVHFGFYFAYPHLGTWVSYLTGEGGGD